MTGPGTNTYVIGGHDARDVMVIDPGPAGYPQHVVRVADVATRHGHASAVIVTHHHLDHAGCAAETARRLEAPLLAFAHNSGPDPDRRLKDGERLSVGAERIHVLHTPGHASDHACLYWEDEGVLFAGDMVTTQGTVVISPPDGSMADYLDSLERLRDLGARQIRPGHGDPIDSPRDFLEQYIAHRLMREAKVVAALSAHPDGARAEEMLPSVYDDVS